MKVSINNIFLACFDNHVYTYSWQTIAMMIAYVCHFVGGYFDMPMLATSMLPMFGRIQQYHIAGAISVRNWTSPMLWVSAGHYWWFLIIGPLNLPILTIHSSKSSILEGVPYGLRTPLLLVTITMMGSVICWSPLLVVRHLIGGCTTKIGVNQPTIPSNGENKTFFIATK